MPNIHFVTGNKGNVGKSLWASSIIEHYRSCGMPLIHVDADNDSRTLRSTYDGALILMLSDDPIMASQPDILMDIAEAEDKKIDSADLMVDLPAGGDKAINKWIEDCDLGSKHGSSDVLSAKIFKWWLSDADPDSIDLFEKSVKDYPSITHIFLKNMGRTREHQWGSILPTTSLVSLKKKKKIKIIELPVLAPDTINTLRGKNIEMSAALLSDEVPASKRLRVKSWLYKTGVLIENELGLEKERKARDKAIAKKKSAEEKNMLEKKQETSVSVAS